MYQHSRLVDHEGFTDAQKLEAAAKPVPPRRKPKHSPEMGAKPWIDLANQPAIASKPKPSSSLNIWQVNYDADTTTSPISPDIKPIPRPRPRKTPPPRPPLPSLKHRMEPPTHKSVTNDHVLTVEPLIDFSSSDSNDLVSFQQPCESLVASQPTATTVVSGEFRMGEEEFIQDIDRHYEATAGFEEKHFCQQCEDGVFHMH